MGHGWLFFFHRESFDKLRKRGDGEVREELHGRVGSLWDLGFRNYVKTGAGCANRLSLLPVLPHPNPLPEGEGTFEIVS